MVVIAGRATALDHQRAETAGEMCSGCVCFGCALLSVAMESRTRVIGLRCLEW